MIALFLSAALALSPLKLSTTPPRVGEIEVTIDTRAAAQGREVKAVLVEGDMFHPGMVPVSATAEKHSSGVYVAKLKLTMAGDWRLTATVEYAGGKREQQHLDLNGVK